MLMVLVISTLLIGVCSIILDKSYDSDEILRKGNQRVDKTQSECRMKGMTLDNEKYKMGVEEYTDRYTRASSAQEINVVRI